MTTTTGARAPAYRSTSPQFGLVWRRLRIVSWCEMQFVEPVAAWDHGLFRSRRLGLDVRSIANPRGIFLAKIGVLIWRESFSVDVWIRATLVDNQRLRRKSMMNRLMWTMIGPTFLFAVAFSFGGPGSVPRAAAVELEKITVPAGTRLLIGLDDALDTGDNKDGDRFSGFLDAALSVDVKTVVPRGTKLYGRLRKVAKAGRFRGKAELVVELTDIRLDDQLIPIVTDGFV